MMQILYALPWGLFTERERYLLAENEIIFSSKPLSSSDLLNVPVFINSLAGINLLNTTFFSVGFYVSLSTTVSVILAARCRRLRHVEQEESTTPSQPGKFQS